MTIIENVFSPFYYEEIKETMLGGEFPWYYNTQTSLVGPATVISEETKDSKQFNHIFFHNDMGDKPNSNAFPMVEPLKYVLEDHINKKLKFLRVKANMLMKDIEYPENLYNIPHIDWYPELDKTKGNYFSFLYYVNDSDGDTILFKEDYYSYQKQPRLTMDKRNTPKANTGIFFRSDLYHASSPPRVSERRVVINYVFKETI